jgi:hypothetical protein
MQREIEDAKGRLNEASWIEYVKEADGKTFSLLRSI